MAKIIDGDIEESFFHAAYSISAFKPIALDIETSGLDYIHDRIATIQVHIPDIGTQIVRVRDEQAAPMYIARLLQDPLVLKVFHYGMFDLSFIGYRWKTYARRVIDTRIAATIIDPYRNRFWNPTRNKYDHGLAALVYTYYGDTLDKATAVSDWFGNLSPAQLDYAEKDVTYLPLLVDRLHGEMSEQQREIANMAYMWLPGKVYCKINNVPDPLDRV
jgi:ribonuclease D